MGRVVSVTSRPRFTPGTHCIGKWVGLETGLDTEAKSFASAGNRTPVFQSAVRHYTDWATPAQPLLIQVVVSHRRMNTGSTLKIDSSNFFSGDVFNYVTNWWRHLSTCVRQTLLIILHAYSPHTHTHTRARARESWENLHIKDQKK
jgi:hypothetical protein